MRIPVRPTLGLFASLFLAACGATSTGAGTSPSASPSALIHTQSITVGTKTETVLKNNKGLTLYYLTADTPTTIACTGACATNWPPLLEPSGDPTSNPALPGTLTAFDGPNGRQVLYNGHPLYTYKKDGDSGDAYGQGIGGKWFVATPDLAAGTGNGHIPSPPPIY